MTAATTSTTASGRGGVLSGVGNLTRREVASWWSTGRWRLQAAVWTVMIAGLAVLMLWVLPGLLPEAEAGLAGDVTEAARNLTDLVAVIVAIGVVLAHQGLILDERRNGVLEWLLSKPLSRPAVIVAKFTGHGLGVLLTVIVIPWLAVLALLSIADGSLYSPGRTAAAAGMIALVALFHLALVLLLSTLTTSRIAVLAIPIVAVVSSDGLVAMAPQLFQVLPWSLGGVASVMLSDGVLITGWPIAATIAWTVLLLAAASWRFEHADL